ncbi:MAG: CpXC domain-containing protein, partial [Bacteroidales bacterium]|nr:CpXC domain-containing protein [Bacteroidales bacterium]
MNATVNTSCKKCGARHEMPAYSSIDISADPSLKEKVVSGELFTWTCPSCGTVNLVKYPFMYHDPAQKLLLVLSDAALKAESVPEGYTARRVRSVGELIEKIKISDAGLDDVAVELCKYVTLQEMGKEASLRFLKTEGADNELIFTYPEKGEMQMISVGFNVYE